MARRSARNALAKLLVGVTAVLLAAAAGCSAPAAVAGRPEQQSSNAPVGAADRAHILVVYNSHCGACHRPVPPGSEPSDRLQAELIRHRKRARLTEQEWAGLDAFLVRR